MSRIDWDTMLSGLESQRTGLEQELADVDAVIHAVRQRSAPKVSVASITRPRGNGAKAKAKPAANGKRQDKITPDQLATMRTQFEAGAKVAEICKRVGVSDATVYTRAKAGHWKRPGKAKTARPNAGVAALPAAAAPVPPAGTQLSGSVKCTDPECGVMTDYDPCRRCGKKLKRKGW